MTVGTDTPKQNSKETNLKKNDNEKTKIHRKIALLLKQQKIRTEIK